jgi:hypothetical protein
VFVRRKGVRSLGAVPSGASADDVTPSMIAPTKITQDSVAPMSSVQPSSILEVRPPSRLPQYLIVVVALVIGFAGGALLTGGSEQPLDAVVVPNERAGATREVPAVTATPNRSGPAAVARSAGVPGDVPVDEAEPETKKPQRKSRRVRRPRPVTTEVPDAPAPPAEPAVGVRLDRLEARLGKLTGGPKHGTATKLLARIAMVRAAQGSDRAVAQVDQLEAEVKRLESGRSH